ncbi:MAG: AzlC family ABC transporter permease [Rhizobiaceae bacterium]|nr:AzlC family ABC transporter permease [Rhizobiaceae bacterium]
MVADTPPERRPADQFLRGMRAAIPVVVASAPFGVLFGALAVKNGLDVWETVAMSAAIYGGASQMVGIELFNQQIAPWAIVLSIFAVNFRHTLYSAVVGRNVPHWNTLQKAIGFFFLVDPQFAESERQVERGETITFVWYMGMALPVYVFWVAEAWIGGTFGKMLPDTHAIGLDFLLPIYFLGLVLEFRDRAFWLPVVLTSGASSIAAYVTVGSPWHVSIGMGAGIALAVFLTPAGPREADR